MGLNFNEFFIQFLQASALHRDTKASKVFEKLKTKFQINDSLCYAIIIDATYNIGLQTMCENKQIY